VYAVISVIAALALSIFTRKSFQFLKAADVMGTS
jgi:hypothetical protein